MNMNTEICTRCGRSAPGKERWMFHQLWLVLSREDMPIRTEYFCYRCLRRHRIHAAIALTVLLIVFIAVVVMAISLRSV